MKPDAKQRTLHVQPHPRRHGCWCVRFDGRSRAYMVFNERKDAVRWAEATSHRLVIHRHDGTVERVRAVLPSCHVNVVDL